MAGCCNSCAGRLATEGVAVLVACCENANAAAFCCCCWLATAWSWAARAAAAAALAAVCALDADLDGDKIIGAPARVGDRRLPG